MQGYDTLFVVGLFLIICHDISLFELDQGQMAY